MAGLLRAVGNLPLPKRKSTTRSTPSWLISSSLLARMCLRSFMANPDGISDLSRTNDEEWNRMPDSSKMIGFSEVPGAPSLMRYLSAGAKQAL